MKLLIRRKLILILGSLIFLIHCNRSIILLPNYLYFLEIPAKNRLYIRLTEADKFETIIENKSSEEIKINIEKDSMLLPKKSKKIFNTSLNDKGLIISNYNNIDVLVRVKIKKIKGNVETRQQAIE